MSVLELEWGDANRNHIARHGISPEEAEQAATIDPPDADIQQHEN
jgi:hypothetical protein